MLESRHRRLDHLEPVAVEPGRRREQRGLTFEAAEVPHARDRRYRTFAWRVADARSSVVYASDVARLEPTLERFARGAQLLVVDGAMWQRSLVSHLTIDRELPELCRWPVTVSFEAINDIALAASDVLALRLSTRIGTSDTGGFCGGHASASGLRVYFRRGQPRVAICDQHPGRRLLLIR